MPLMLGSLIVSGRFFHGTVLSQNGNTFGGLAILLEGHMFCRVVKGDLMLRRGRDAAAAAIRQPYARPMDLG